MHKTSMDLMEHLVKKHLNFGSIDIIDIGSKVYNRGCYKDIISLTEHTYKGMDITSGKNVDIVATDIYSWPVEDCSFDVAISGQCLEHVGRPWQWAKEIYRIVRHGGLTIIIAPWSWNPHYYPIDCWRILPDGMMSLLEYAGFECIDTNMVEKDCYGVGRKA